MFETSHSSTICPPRQRLMVMPAVDGPAGGRYSHQLAGVRCACRPAGGDVVAVGELVIDRDMQVGQACAVGLHECLKASMPAHVLRAARARPRAAVNPRARGRRRPQLLARSAAGMTVRGVASELAWLRSRDLVCSRTVHSHDGRRELWSVIELGRHAPSSPVLGTGAAQLLGVLYAGPKSTRRLAEQTGASAHSVLHGIAALREHYLCEPPPAPPAVDLGRLSSGCGSSRSPATPRRCCSRRARRRPGARPGAARGRLLS